MYINLHTHRFTNYNNVIEIVNQYPKEFNPDLPNYSMGIHPWYLNEDTLTEELSIIEKNIESASFKAVGECGLDKRIETSIDIQKKILIPQLLLAENYKKPIILHCVSAYQEIIEIKKDLKLSVPMIIHGFSKNIQVAESLLKNGFYLSFGKYLLLNHDLVSVFKQIPLDKLFLETDTIDQSIFDVYQKAEDILGESVIAQVQNNYNRVFNQ